MAQRSLEEKLNSLNSHLFSIRRDIEELDSRDGAYKDLSTKLRVLIAHSSGTEGLLWRLCDELGVSDIVSVSYSGSVNTDHPLSEGLFLHVGLMNPITLPESEQIPINKASLKQVIKEYESVFIDNISLTFESLIKKISQKIGTAHEDDTIPAHISYLRKFALNKTPIYIQLLKDATLFVLEIGERILLEAKERGFIRQKLSKNDGNITLAFKINPNTLKKSENILTIYSPLSNHEFIFLRKKNEFKIKIKYYDNNLEYIFHSASNSVIFAILYNSNQKVFRFWENGIHKKDLKKDFGWISGIDVKFSRVSYEKSVTYMGWGRLLKGKEIKGLIPNDLSGMLVDKEVLKKRKGFPD